MWPATDWVSLVFSLADAGKALCHTSLAETRFQTEALVESLTGYSGEDSAVSRPPCASHLF